MHDTTPNPARADRVLHGVVYTRAARVATSILVVASGGGTIALLCWLLFSSEPVNPLRLMRLFSAVVLLPWLCLRGIRRLGHASLEAAPDRLVLSQQERRMEIPHDSLREVVAWRAPLPGPGLSFRVHSGPVSDVNIELDDPHALLRLLPGALAGHAVAMRSVALAWRGWPATNRRSLLNLALRFPLFAVLPTVPLFRVHQLIAYGGPLGEYYQYGLGPYLAGAAIYWATLTIYLILYAAALRVPAEFAVLCTAAFAPQYAQAVRSWAERMATALYFVGVPVAIALRFVPW